MKPCRILTAIVFALFYAPGLITDANAAPSNEEQATLWPGESWTYGGITITWKMDDPETSESVGKLIIKSPKTAVADLTPPLKRADKNGKKIYGYADQIALYMDETWFQFSAGGSGPAGSLTIYARRMESKQVFEAYQMSRSCAASVYCPVSLNQWRLTLSDEDKGNPEQPKHMELCCTNMESGERLTMPAAANASRIFGRFKISISNVYDSTRTIYFSVEAKADFTKCGGGSYIPQCSDLNPKDDNISCADYLDRLARQYAFEVKWLERKDFPEGAEFLNRIKATPVQFSGSSNVSGSLSGLLGETIKLGPHLFFEWKDSTHLEVSPDYDTEIAAKLAEKEAATLRADWEKRFQKEYNLEMRSYPLLYAQASAVKGLIEPLLNTYRLIAYPASQEPGDKLPGKTIYRIEKYDPNRALVRTSILLKSEEKCIADDRGNALVVMAIPQTLAQVEDRLAQLEHGMAESAKTQGPAARFRIEAILLQGGMAGEKIEDASRMMKLSFSVPGIVKEALVSSGMKIKVGDAIMHLEPAQQEQQLKLAELELAHLEIQLNAAQNAFARAKTHSASKVISQEDFEKSEADLRTAQINLETARMKLEAARGRLSACVLAAPQSGTIAKILISPNERVEAGQIVATMIPDEKPAAPPSAKTGAPQDAKAGSLPGAQADSFSSDLAAQFGLSREDLKLFGFDGVVQLGKGITTLIAERGEAGRTLVALTDEYRCQLEFLDERPPYLVVKTSLSGPQSEKPLLENTSFLEKGKPAIIGLTNLRQALILVLRLHDAPPAAPPAAK